AFHLKSSSRPALSQRLLVGRGAAAGERSSANAIAAAASISGSRAAAVRREKNSSRNAVESRPARNSESASTSRKKEMLVRNPVSAYSERARSSRWIARSRDVAQAASLASNGSYSSGTVQPS